MKKLLSIILIIFCIFSSYQISYAAQDIYQFTSIQNQNRFQTLTTQLRCLVCQNQNLAESNSGLANDLRLQIYQQIQQGKSDPDIINYLVNRYGDFILYQPPFKAHTIALWLTPFILLLFGLSYLIYYVRKEHT